MYGLKTTINPRFEEEVCIAILDYVRKNGWKQGVNYSQVVSRLVHEVVFGNFDNSLVFEYQPFAEEQFKIDNKPTQLSTADKRSLVKVARSKHSTMTEILNDQAKKHMKLY